MSCSDLVSRAPYNKVKSISTGDLLNTGSNVEWPQLKCTSTDSMETRVLLGVSRTTAPESYRFTVRRQILVCRLEHVLNKTSG